MPGFSLYLFVPSPDGPGPRLERREIQWLLKNQVGYAFSLGQVEPCALGDRPALLEATNLDEVVREELTDAIEGFTGDQDYYVSPVDERVDEERLAHRLSTVDRVGVIDNPHVPDDVECLDGAGDFWSEESGLPRFLPFAGQSGPALMNVAHPYRTGPVWDADEGRLYRLTDDGFESGGTDPDGVIYTVLRTVHDGDVDNLVASMDDISGHLASQYNLRVAEHNMKDEVDEGRLVTRALGPSSVMVRFPGAGGSIRDELVLDAVDRLDWLGLTIAGEFQAGDDRVLLFKLHPRDDDLDGIGPAFDADHELRKLRQVAWARESLPGFKFSAGGGNRLTVLDAFDGWTVYAEKPGIKDPSDFKVQIEGPELTETLDAQPEFVKIFAEAMWNLHCPDSGEAFLAAVHRLWSATDDAEELPTVIGELTGSLPPCRNADELRYPRRAFLWMLAMLFIIEDVNYRFNPHPLPQFNPPLYRKQGRDQPMNAILQLGASGFSDDLAEDLGTRSINEGGTYARPRGFGGPDHLRGWYGRHGIGG